MKIKTTAIIVILVCIAFSLHAQGQMIEDFKNEVYQLKSINPGEVQVGFNRFSATLVNMSDTARNCIIDIRTESIALGRPNWQGQFYFQINPREERMIELEYEIASPILIQFRLLLGETETYFDQDAWSKLPYLEKKLNPAPKFNIIWTKKVPGNMINREKENTRETIDQYDLLLNAITPERLSFIKSTLPSLIKKSRFEENSFRERLKDLFLSERDFPQDFDPRPEDWTGNSSKVENMLEGHDIHAEVFSISGESGNRITAFTAAQNDKVDRKLPLILFLSGNPPGTKESLVGPAIYFARLGYRTVGVDRRESALSLDSKEKLLPNFSDPVSDTLRLLEFLRSHSDFEISKIGVYGFSAGAGEAKFIAALDDRIDAVVMACGITSFNWLFKNQAWIPTLAGMTIFPELGLGSPDLSNLTSEEFWEYFNKVKPEHNSKAKEIYNRLFPFFSDLDPEKVVPLIAPIPSLIVSGAQDDQFIPSGVVDVDNAAQAAYRKYKIRECAELYIQPRTGHSVSHRAASIITAFFDRWLKEDQTN
ncbi:alpha/beta hydrolase family protein [Acidobacteriota bacterium]